jgi:hypothetical protein
VAAAPVAALSCSIGLSMRTLSAKVDGDRWRRSLSGRGLSQSLPAERVAVLACCTSHQPGFKELLPATDLAMLGRTRTPAFRIRSWWQRFP